MAEGFVKTIKLDCVAINPTPSGPAVPQKLSYRFAH
jgi:hypothetical protein